MHASEANRRSHRRRPELNINTSPLRSRSHDARPSTPPSIRRPPVPSKGKPPVSNHRALRMQQPPSVSSSTSSRDYDDTFFDSLSSPLDTAMDNKENEHEHAHDRHGKNNALRDSHDLSLSPRQITRDSLVANMLMSLDQFSLGQIHTPSTPAAPFDEPGHSNYRSMSLGGDDPTRTISSVARPSRMHSAYQPGHSYTYSSDYEGDDLSSQYSRSRRSNSSSGFQANLGRLHSMRETTSPRGASTSGGRPLHSRGGKTSKNSSLNSFDGGYAQVLGSQRWAHGLGGRSSSFDMGQGQKPSLGSLTLPTNGGVDGGGGGGGGYGMGSHSAFNLEFTNTLWTEDYEAAPTPTVPGGPRRSTLTSASATAIPSPAIPSQHHYPHPDHAETDHKVPTAPNSDRLMSMRSSRSATAGRAAASSARYDMPPPPQPPLPLPPNDSAIAADEDDDDLDDDMEDSAPSPHIGYEKTTKEKEKEKALPPAGSSQQQQPTQQSAKERPGFFRRVFGSSKTLASAFDTSSTSPHVSPTSVETQARPGSKQQNPSSQQKSASTPPSRDSQQPSAFTGQHVIQKKSSFFRRRKKSIAEPLPPVPRPPSEHMSQPGLGVEPARMSDKPDPSPVSSLRQVMNPYLRSESAGTSSLGLLGPRQERGNVSPQYDVEDREEDRRRKTGRGFSPDYEPGPKATIRTVKSQSALFTRNRESMGLGASKRTPVESPPMPTERPKLTRDTTFFEDSSDTDADKATPLPPDELYNPTPRPSPSPRPGAGKDDTRGQRGRGQGDMGPDDGLYKAEVSPGLEPVASNEADTRPSSLGLPIQDQDPARPTSLGLPIQDQHSSARGSVSTDNGAADALPSFTVDSAEASPKQGGSPLDEPEVTIGEPTEDDRQKAQRIFDGNEDFIQKSRAAAWMGEEGPVRQRTLQAYMELYDFSGKSVLTCLREVCGRLILRAETQQVDRILVGFSKRWCDCNPHHGFKALDVIHTLCYSIMLLNTDLHMADIESKMTRSQFVKNTMTTIVQALEDYVPDAFERPSILPGRNPHLNPADSDVRAPPEPAEKINWRASFLQPRSDSRMGDNGDGSDACGPLVKSPFYGSMRAWEGQMETVLKDIYTSIRDDKLPLFGGATEAQNAQSGNSLSVLNVLSRTPSVLSKAPSEQQSMRGRMDGVNRPPGSRWTSKSRSRPRLGTAGFSSSRTSFDDENSIWSPAMSSATWSRYSLGRTQTSPSVDSLGSALHRGEYHQSIGFANALSHAIIREDGGPLTTSQSYMSGDGHGAELEDESLELYGSPWAKEGLVVHKHHMDGSDGKKAKDRNWSEVFAVVQKGTMTLFSFSAKSMRNKGRSGRKQSAPGGVVGGGNWQENATTLGSFSLQQTMASALPAPGYSRTRPHVWALSLPNGAIHLFQVGTPEVGKEFIDTVTYWSARLSTHPLVGGISNIEYGWSDACINNALVSAINDNAPPPRPGSAAAAGRQSMHSRSGSRQSSLRSSFDMGTSGNRLKLPGDRIHIADWSPPASSLRPSHCSEVEQLETLIAYVQGIEDELQQHNRLRSPMLLAFTPRGSNATKAMANWERKSDYLLREIVKFQTYVDGLRYAQRRRKEIEDEREVAHRAARGDEILDDEDNLGEARLAADQ